MNRNDFWRAWKWLDAIFDPATLAGIMAGILFWSCCVTPKVQAVRKVDWCVHRCYYNVYQNNAVIDSVIETKEQPCDSYTDGDSFLSLANDHPYLTYMEVLATEEGIENYKKKARILCGGSAKHEQTQNR